MTAVEIALGAYRRGGPPGWLGSSPFRLAHRIEPGATRTEITEAWHGRTLAPEVVALRTAARESWLFRDVEYGQWGLHLLSPADSAARTALELAARPSDFLDGDIVIGEFLGDSDLLVLSPLARGQNRVLVAAPLDPREEWHGAGGSLAEVIALFHQKEGAKYWEST